ncbi:MAG: regulatory signaling modulator protein AmpE [Gammaproteobacteria bacterium]
MNFVALLLGLGVERLLTHLFHLREFRWLDPMFDWLTERLREESRTPAVIGVILFTTIAVLPVALVAIALGGTLLQIPYFILAVLVLLFSLGPRDLQTEVDDYCAAERARNPEDTVQVARELWEGDVDEDPNQHVNQVRRAIFIQANNRIFAVVFWFLLLGPTGAWLFRVLDLMRRRLAFEYNRTGHDFCNTALVWAVRSVHGVFAWLPARVLILGYALAGSFDGAIAAWRAYFRATGDEFFRATNDLLDCVGNGATGSLPEMPPPGPGPDASADMLVGAAMDLVSRTLWLIWCPAIAVLTLTDWLS